MDDRYEIVADGVILAVRIRDGGYAVSRHSLRVMRDEAGRL